MKTSMLFAIRRRVQALHGFKRHVRKINAKTTGNGDIFFSVCGVRNFIHISQMIEKLNRGEKNLAKNFKFRFFRNFILQTLKKTLSEMYPLLKQGCKS